MEQSKTEQDRQIAEEIKTFEAFRQDTERISELNIGDARRLLAIDLRHNIEKIINKRQKKANYHILVFAEHTPQGVTTKLLILPGTTPIPKMLGTILYYVDNRGGRLIKKWVLPLDLPRTDQYVSFEEGVKEIADAAKGQLIVY